MIRVLNPTDLALLLLFLGKSPTNVAMTREKFDCNREGIFSIIPTIRHCLIPQDGRQILGYSQRGSIRGLVSLRKRSGPTVWEIDRLLLSPDYNEFCVDLLERLGTARDDNNIERLFLRLESSSPLVDMAKQAGFRHYNSEKLYRISGVPTQHSWIDSKKPDMRIKDDDYALFRFFSASVPLQIRIVEGMTFQEWVENREKDTWKEFLEKHQGEISAWLKLRSDRMAGQFDIITMTDSTNMSHLIDFCLYSLRDRYPIYCLVAEYQEPLKRILEERGFQQIAEYCCLNKQFAVRIRESKLVPMQA